MRITASRVTVGCALIAALVAVTMVRAQSPNDPWHDRYGRDGRYDAYTRPARLEAGTFVTVRTQQPIETSRREDRGYPAVVDRDVWDTYGRLAVPVIPNGSPAELRVRTARDGDLILDLDSVLVDGRRYIVAAQANRIEGRPRGTSGNQAAEYIGTGAILGTIIGAVAGGGKGAAIGAAAGAGAGAVVMTTGRQIRVPAGSELTFRLDQDLTVGGRGDSYRRNR